MNERHPMLRAVLSTLILTLSIQNLVLAQTLTALAYRENAATVGGYGGRPRITDSGLVAYVATQQDGNAGIHLGPIFGNHDIVVSQRDRLPGLSDLQFIQTPNFEMNERGSIILSARLGDSIEDPPDAPFRFKGHGAWSWVDGELTPLAITDQPLPGEEIVSRDLGLLSININDHDELVLAGSATDPEASHRGGGFVLRGTPESTRLVALSIVDRMENPRDAKFFNFPWPILNNSGDLYYVEYRSGGFDEQGWLNTSDGDTILVHDHAIDQYDSSGGSGVTLDGEGGLHLIRWFDVPPQHPVGFGDGAAVFQWTATSGLSLLFGHPARTLSTVDGEQLSWASRLATNNVGDLVANLRVGEGDDSDDAIAVIRDEQVSRVIGRDGTTPQGVDGDYTFDGFAPFWAEATEINDRGQVMFTKAFRSHPDEEEIGIWAESLAGELLLVASTESDYLFEIDGVAHKKNIENIFYPSMNNNGEIVFAADFTDGSSGVIYSSAVAVPEPSGRLFGPFLGLLMLGGRRRRNQ